MTDWSTSSYLERIATTLDGIASSLETIAKHLAPKTNTPEVQKVIDDFNKSFQLPPEPPLSRQECIARLTEEREKDSRPLELRLRDELAKVPTGTQYIAAPNYPKIKKLLEEATPFYPEPSINDPEGIAWTGWKWTSDGNQFSFVHRTDGRTILTQWPKNPFDSGRPLC